MYVGPWQEFHLFRAMEELCEKKGRIACRAPSNTAGLASETAPPSSHHLRLNLGGTEDTTSGEFPSNVSTPLTVAASQARRHTTTRQLRQITRVRDVDVFVEEDVPKARASGKEGSQHEARPTLEHRMKRSTAATSSTLANAMGKFSQKRAGNGSKLSSSDQKGSTSMRRTPQTARTVSTNLSANMHSMNVEIGTGVVRKEQKMDKADPLSVIRKAFLTSSTVGETEGLSSDHPLLRELVLGSDISTKMRFLGNNQQPAVSTHRKKTTKVDSTDDARVKEQIERRLRLQMMYSGGISRDDTQSACWAAASPKIVSETQTLVEADAAAAAVEGITVPWDLPLLVTDCRAVDLNRATNSTQRQETPKCNRTQAVPLRVVTPAASSCQLPELCEADALTEQRINAKPYAADPFPSQCGGKFHTNRPTLDVDMLGQVDAEEAGMHQETLDDDVVGALLDWAEQLNPDNLLLGTW
ncbi:hypothetical protein ERJ75_000957800 [Trypanosoma vivax]|uniref:Uncharacterized protein n=1 Tax=Trypanosoma vivax (strain Y486) TaxID=1055687 RepID=G0U4S5_TRYVY|nr:hypothetical protein TRVL_02739 [Trypanosoma vivax]KAH8611945.1 hypothetical protein ERJ75_000957800 [Trypanosoma vivax]CCC52440.1 conserved hypothetical protein [Trypanosoma vivax Y486]